MNRITPRIVRRLTPPVLPMSDHPDTLDGEPTHPTGAPQWMWVPGEIPPDVTPAPFRDAWAGNHDTDRYWSHDA